MKLSEKFDVSSSKIDSLMARIARLKINPGVIEEDFVRGGGKGGQKINKTANRVQLYYPPLDIFVSCQRDRRRTVNRFLALRELVDRIEMRVSPSTSHRLDDARRMRRRKARRRDRSVQKYGLT